MLKDGRSDTDKLLTLYLMAYRICLFGEPFLALLPTTEARDAAVKHAVEVLEAVGRQQHDGSFTVNYIRLRFVAQKARVKTP